ncbi:MAG: radical SAM protein, partial [Bacteroidota bacterium]
MANPILDNHGRPITYVRLAVTDRCNLRCFYCMPAEGIKYMPRKELLTYEEMLRLVRILANMGINKVRLTGGEPFVRKDLATFLRELHAIPGITQLHLTTNGVLTTPHVPLLKELGVKVNLSLDSLDRERFKAMTRRDELSKVMACLDALQAAGVPTKLNAVIMAGHNTQDIVPLAAYTQEHPVEVRFIEEMPFNGSGGERSEARAWSHQQI